MPKAEVIGAYFDRERGRYVAPPAEVDLTQERFDRLKAAGCIKAKSGRPPKGGGKSKAGEKAEDEAEKAADEGEKTADEGEKAADGEA